MKNYLQPSKHGFTLIELLVVISIISLLISILLPALGSARRAARVTGCLSNIRQLGMAQQMHANDHDDRISYEDRTGRGNRGVSHDEKLSPYDGRNGQGTQFWLARATSASRTSIGSNSGLASELWMCPLDDLPQGWPNANPAGGWRARRSYGVSEGATFEDRLAAPTAEIRRTGVAKTISNQEGWSAKFTELRQASGTIIMFDYAHARGWQGNTGDQAHVAWAMNGTDRSWYVRWINRGYPEYPSKFYAHSTKLGADPTPNTVFADGHAESVNVIEELASVGSTPDDPITVGTRFDALR